MSSETNRNKLGQTRRESAESKAVTTKRVSQEILQAEAEQRQAKTQKLRAARLAMQAGQTDPQPENTRTAGPKKRIRAKA